jgi:hypothetical protein
MELDLKKLKVEAGNTQEQYEYNIISKTMPYSLLSFYHAHF